jgi:hypothetical protein
MIVTNEVNWRQSVGIGFVDDEDDRRGVVECDVE